MSYVRWSDDIKNVLSTKCYLELIMRGFTHKEIKTFRDHLGPIYSDWYIYETFSGYLQCEHRTGSSLSLNKYDAIERCRYFDPDKKDDLHEQVLIECLLRWIKEGD